MNSRNLCIMACAFCRDKAFHDWMTEVADVELYGHLLTGGDEALAKAFILDACQVESRNDLDTNPDAAQRFHDLVRKPFLEWKEARHA